MTGYQSKKAMAQDKLAQPAQEPWPEEPFGHMAGGVQPAQEPVAWLTRDSVDGCWYATAKKVGKDDKPLYATPPQRPWVDLTDNQIEQIYYDLVKIHRGAPMPWGQIQFGKVLQAAIREANK